ncbi:MAG: hypothetical protein JOZ47_08685 [Kutzneria sp.]|nr:hypothetical protein [Kutzneria sp.]
MSIWLSVTVASTTVVVGVAAGAVANWIKRPAWMTGTRLWNLIGLLVLVNVVLVSVTILASSGSDAAPVPSSTELKELMVPANQLISPQGGGTDSGMSLERGDTVTVTASGIASYSRRGETDCPGIAKTDPNGNRTDEAGRPCPAKKHPYAPLPSAPIGMLLARIGTGEWTAVGSGATIQASSGGRLVLGYNDWSKDDNTGAYDVVLHVSR